MEFWLHTPARLDFVEEVNATGLRKIIDLRSVIELDPTQVVENSARQIEEIGSMGLCTTLRWPETAPAGQPRSKRDVGPTDSEIDRAMNVLHGMVNIYGDKIRRWYLSFGNEPGGGPGRITTPGDLDRWCQFIRTAKDEISSSNIIWTTSGFASLSNMLVPEDQLTPRGRWTRHVKMTLFDLFDELDFDAIDQHLHSDCGDSAEHRLTELDEIRARYSILNNASVVSMECGIAKCKDRDHLLSAVTELFEVFRVAEDNGLDVAAYAPFHPNPNGGPNGSDTFVWSAAMERSGDRLWPFFDACRLLGGLLHA